MGGRKGGTSRKCLTLNQSSSSGRSLSEMFIGWPESRRASTNRSMSFISSDSRPSAKIFFRLGNTSIILSKMSSFREDPTPDANFLDRKRLFAPLNGRKKFNHRAFSMSLFQPPGESRWLIQRISTMGRGGKHKVQTSVKDGSCQSDSVHGISTRSSAWPNVCDINLIMTLS